MFVVQASLAQQVCDDTQQNVFLLHPAKRIISLAPDLTEILFAIGAGNKVIAVVRGSDYPAAAKKLPVIATANQLDSEAIIALHPDLIVAWAGGVSPTALRQLKQSHIPVYLSWQKKITDIPQTMLRLGKLTGTKDKAQLAADVFLKRYLQLKKQFATKKPVTVFYQVWSQPLITITKNSWINDVIELCGGKNIFADLPGVSPQVSMEAVIARQPAVIFGDPTIWQQWLRLHARFYYLNPDLIERAGPRLIEGATVICRDLA